MIKSCWTVILVYAATFAGAALAEESADAGSKPLTVIVTDAMGAPVAGALIGNHLRNENAKTGDGPLKFERFVRSKEAPDAANSNQIRVEMALPVVADGEGKAKLVVDDLLRANVRGGQTVIAMSADRKQMGIVSAPPYESASEIRISLAPLVEHTVHCRCPAVPDSKLQYTTISLTPGVGLPYLVHSSMTKSHVLRLPKGNYKLTVASMETYPVRTDLEVGGEKDEFEVELSPKLLLSMVGKPAPELVEIKEWLGGDPVTLTELQGKVVVLDFFGIWCGPCMSGMPHLFDLHERFHEKGLVIIGIHDDSVENGDQVKERLAQLKEGAWKGRGVPFTIAIDGGGEQKVAGQDRVVRGKTTATYGINGWPSYVLIDRKGVIRDGIRPTNPEDIKLLESLLAETP